MSNHMARTWDHRRSKPFGLKLLSLGHHLDDFIIIIIIIRYLSCILLQTNSFLEHLLVIHELLVLS
jgi:hypothetical protein